MLSRRTFVVALAAASATGLAACSGQPPAGASGSPAGASGETATAGDFPITITHAFGKTTVEKRPERIATVAWANHEVPLALGIVPVGMAKATWGDDDADGLLPWVKDKLDELGGDAPVLFDETDALDFEAIANTAPDVILAAYSGLSQDDYDTLSKIAPTVAFPDAPWGTTMDEMIRLNSQAMGLAAEGEALIASLDGHVAAAMAHHPDLVGKKVLFASLSADDLSKVTLYTTHDPRVAFLIDAGLAAPQVVVDETAKTEAFFVEISAEKPELLDDVDIVLAYSLSDPAALLDALKASPLLSRVPAIAAGHVVTLGSDPLAASANPSPLSIPWGVEKYLAKLAEGLKD